MDKETLSNYGWIVICVLVLSVMIALATPFGSFISDAVQNTTQGLFKTEQNAMGKGLSAAGIKLKDATFGDTNTIGGNNGNNSGVVYGINHPALNPTGGEIPEGGTYYRGFERIPFVWFCDGCGNFVAGREEDGIYNSEGVKIKEEDITGCCEGCGTYNYGDYGDPMKLDAFPDIAEVGDVYVHNGLAYFYNVCECSTSNISYDGTIDIPSLMNYSCNGYSCQDSKNGSEWHVAIIDSTAITSDVMFLETINGSPVNVSWNTIFKNNNSLEATPLLPDTITDMSYMFEGCASLKEVTNFPKNVTSLYYTFASCGFEETPVLPDTITDVYGAFQECTSLTTVTNFPKSVTNMDFAFYDCTNLTNIPAIPSSVTSLCYTFAGCGFEETPYLPDTIVDMTYAFMGCTSLKTVTNFPKNITSLEGAFCSCTSLINVPYIPDTVGGMHIAFFECTSLKELPNVPSSCTYLSTGIMSSGLTKLPSLPDTLTDLGLVGLASLETISQFPQGLTSLWVEEYTSLKTLPALPSGIKGLNFYHCPELKTLPAIPSSVTNLFLSDCPSLTGEIEINTDVIEHYGSIFSSIDFQAQKINLTGSSTRLDEYGATGRNYCANCNGYCSCGNYTH